MQRDLGQARDEAQRQPADHQKNGIGDLEPRRYPGECADAQEQSDNDFCVVQTGPAVAPFYGIGAPRAAISRRYQCSRDSSVPSARVSSPIRARSIEPTMGIIFAGCLSSQASAVTAGDTPISVAMASIASGRPGTRRLGVPASEWAWRKSVPPPSGLQAIGVILSTRHWSSVPSLRASRWPRWISTWLATSCIVHADWSAEN